MISALPSAETIAAQVNVALSEDLGGINNPDNDITAGLVPATTHAQATIITREDCVISGIAWAQEAFDQMGSDIEVEWLVADGDKVNADTVLANITGNARGILTAERTALNFLQTLSATATVTAFYVAKLTGSHTKILDTRKTLPGLRMAQKYAVTCGGGKNHRIGLYDAYLIKENHVFACGSIAKAVAQANENHPDKPVEVEVENLEELKLAIDAGANIVMLDNFTNEQIEQAVAINQGKAKLEVSGNITDERLKELSVFGVDFISSGALTKHVNAIDLSLRIKF